MADGDSDCGDGADRGDAVLVATREGAILCAVCDGLGASSSSGHPASSLALSMLRAAFDGGAEPHAVLDALADANREMYARSHAARRREPGSDTRWAGMGSTVAVAVFVAGRAYLAHVGDVRIYRMRALLERFTTDHSLVNDARRIHPEWTEEQLRALLQNVIIRALGMKNDVEVDRTQVATASGDIFLLCSDGLTSALPDDEIATMLGREPRRCVRALVDAARNARGAPKDSIAAVVHVVGGKRI